MDGCTSCFKDCLRRSVVGIVNLPCSVSNTHIYFVHFIQTSQVCTLDSWASTGIFPSGGAKNPKIPNHSDGHGLIGEFKCLYFSGLCR
jgi:hypothetical protein